MYYTNAQQVDKLIVYICKADEMFLVLYKCNLCIILLLRVLSLIPFLTDSVIRGGLQISQSSSSLVLRKL